MAQDPIDAAREARRAYDRAWYAKNKESVRRRQREYWERKAASESAVNQAGAQNKLLSRLRSLPLPADEVEELIHLACSAPVGVDKSGQNGTL